LAVASAAVLPDTDEAIAKAVLHEAVKIALGPGHTRTKMAALKVVLDFTKPKPAERRAIRAEGPEGWLRAVLADAPLATPEGQP
jgi:hypothetical protein